MKAVFIFHLWVLTKNLRMCLVVGIRLSFVMGTLSLRLVICEVWITSVFTTQGLSGLNDTVYEQLNMQCSKMLDVIAVTTRILI